MNAENKRYIILLRLLLISAGVAWGVSVAGLVFPWSTVDRQLQDLGARPIDDPMIQYWLKMAAAVYTLIGGFYLVVALRPAKYRAVIPLIGPLHLVLAAILLANGLTLRIDPIPLCVDVGFCLCVGAGLIAVNRKLRSVLKCVSNLEGKKT
ncbi:MAG TPA: hypothetical protein P5279_13780 [Anaerohalosphaeraceae bacterium]|jgi:FtsH-binding integral membrane protein|nr:hypothetical protein [Anaerohalosphaeraceae bacterium]HRT87575.1 hypothetical protein [Anaerohalosphaeraceae bacterium]